MAANYFTCTLGQATSLQSNGENLNSINDFIDSQAKELPKHPAVGFPRPIQKSDNDWVSTIFSFEDVRNGSYNVARLLLSKHEDTIRRRKTVALLCPNTPEFLFTWLALMRLGRAVLLLAPQCTTSAIVHLCKTCEVELLFYDEVYSTQAREAEALMREDGETKLVLANVLTVTQLANAVSGQDEECDLPIANIAEGDVAYLHHTSGTSSGVPKPIPQTHRAGMGVLPSFTEGLQAATFTTTPLYHGGIADLFRAWTSGALIWLFPGKGVPITARNIVKCLDAAERSTQECSNAPMVKYFSSVPYVLQMMETDVEGLRYLQRMDIVGVGGAALPAEVGDRLVQQGVHLVSRFGSAECGFLMSSHRDYTTDGEWQYLRSTQGADSLRFEEQGDGLSELVVLPGWPHMAKKNRDDGSYATADLFAPHPTIHNAWRYHSRADSQLTLITGKKFDPAPLEGEIAASSLLDDALIFGNGQPYPGILLFPASVCSDMSGADLAGRLWPIIEKLNSQSQDHARIPLHMVIPMPLLETPLQKSSKGTILRSATESRFATVIERAYANPEDNGTVEVADGDVPATITDIVQAIVPKGGPLSEEDELFSYGVDSVAGMRIRHRLRQLLPENTRDLPLSVVEDCGNVRRLADFIVKRRRGEDVVQQDDDRKLMLELVERYSQFDTSMPSERITTGNEEAGGDVIILTGATGALGAHILNLYRNMDSVRKIYCLVRGVDQHAAHERVSKALEQRGLPCLPKGTSGNNNRIEVLQAQLGDERLGLDDGSYDRLCREATIIMHVAWSVNFRMKLRSFVKDNVAGVANLINLALRSTNGKTPKFAFCSSVASVMAFDDIEVPEEIVYDTTAASPLGYSQSKWVAEQLCARANETTRLQGNVVVYRVGQLSGDSTSGVWNTKEAWPMMLSAVKVTGSLPALREEILDWLPVDIAAYALVQGASYHPQKQKHAQVFHVVNEHSRPTWDDLLGWLGKVQAFEVVTPADWLEQLAEADTNNVEHPALKLLDHWRKSFKEAQNPGATEGQNRRKFAMRRTKEALPALRRVPPVDKKYFLKVWRWIERNM